MGVLHFYFIFSHIKNINLGISTSASTLSHETSPRGRGRGQGRGRTGRGRRGGGRPGRRTSGRGNLSWKTGRGKGLNGPKSFRSTNTTTSTKTSTKKKRRKGKKRSKSISIEFTNMLGRVIIIKCTRNANKLSPNDYWSSYYDEKDYDYNSAYKFKNHFLGAAVFGEELIYNNDKHEKLEWFQYVSGCRILEAEEFEEAFQEQEIQGGSQKLVNLDENELTA